MIACHFGMFDFNTVAEPWLDEQIARTGDAPVLAPAVGPRVLAPAADRRPSNHDTCEEDHIMKARLVPLYFDPGRDDDFDKQLAAIRTLLADTLSSSNLWRSGTRFPTPRP